MANRDEALSYYKWLWRDFRANRKVQRMDYIAQGLYRSLIDEAWSEGSIPNDLDTLADICGCPVEVMAAAWKQIQPSWELNEHGRWVNDKLEAQRTERDALRVIRSQAGRLGGLVKMRHHLEAEERFEDVERVKHVEVEVKEELAGARQQLVDAEYLLDGAKQTQAKPSKLKQTQAIGKQNESVASVCHIEEKRREEKRREIPSGELTPEPKTLHAACQVLIHRYWHRFHSEDVLAPWDGGEGKQLQQLLSANPGLTAGGFTRLLENRARSDVNHSQRPREWLSTLTDFARGPLDRFNKPKETGDGAQPGSNGSGRIASPTSQRVESGVNAFRRAAAEFGYGEPDGVHVPDGGEIPESGYGGGSTELPLRLQPASPELRTIPSQNSVAQFANKARAEILSQPRRDSGGTGIHDR